MILLILFLEDGRINDKLYNFALKNGFRPQQVKLPQICTDLN